MYPPKTDAKQDQSHTSNLGLLVNASLRLGEGASEITAKGNEAPGGIMKNWKGGYLCLANLVARTRKNLESMIIIIIIMI